MKTKSEYRNAESAFTLIELLVVITIIVVLLALLAPALDRAIHQAELASCGATLRGISTSVTQYAMNFNRRYPDRGLDAHPQKQMHALKWGPTDDRLQLKGFLSFGLFVDPLCEKVNLDPDVTHPNSAVFASYSLFFGYGYTGGSRLDRIGARLTYTPPWDGAEAIRSHVLAMDQDIILKNGWAHGSHPDADGRMVNRALQDEGDTERSLDPVGITAPQMVLSWWEATTTHERGDYDMNISFTDGSVTRFKEVAWDAGWPGNEGDERFAGVPEFGDGTNYPQGPGADGWWQTLPRR